MTKYTKSIMLFTKIATVVYAISCIINLFLPVLKLKTVNLNVFTFLIIGVWGVAILSCHGIFKKVVAHVDGVITYNTIIPVFPITIIRIVELGWIFIKHRSDFKGVNFLIAIAFDVVLIVILLLDKSHYYYEAVESEDE